MQIHRCVLFSYDHKFKHLGVYWRNYVCKIWRYSTAQRRSNFYLIRIRVVYPSSDSRWRSQDTLSSINTFPPRISRNVAPLSSGYPAGSRRMFWTPPQSLVSVICLPSARRHVAFRSDGFICRTSTISLLTAIRHAIVRAGRSGERVIRKIGNVRSDPFAVFATLTPSVSGIRLLASPCVYFAVTNNPLSCASAARCTGKMSTHASRASALV